jgi:hypothetical protein
VGIKLLLSVFATAGRMCISFMPERRASYAPTISLYAPTISFFAPTHIMDGEMSNVFPTLLNECSFSIIGALIHLQLISQETNAY